MAPPPEASSSTAASAPVTQEPKDKVKDPIDTTELRNAMQAAAYASAAAHSQHVFPQQSAVLVHHAQPTTLSTASQNVATGPLHMQYPTAAMPLHILPPQGGFTTTAVVPGAYFSAINKASATPEIFRNRKKRSGKWTTEEESYADALIEVFEKGYIEEKNGSTLRGFLAKKLHCSPMRISKKYAGKGIGKMVFLSKTNMAGEDGVGSSFYNKSIQRLREAENNFMKIVFTELGMVFPTQIPMLHLAVPQFSQPSMIPAVAVPAPGSAQLGLRTIPHSAARVAGIPSGTLPSGVPSLVSPAPSQTESLKQAYHNAVTKSNSTILSTGVPGASAKTFTLPQATALSLQMYQQVPVPQQQSAVSATPQTTATIQPVIPTQPVTAHSMSAIGTPLQAPYLVGRQTITTTYSTQPQAPPVSGPQGADIPDLLSGFDKMADGAQVTKPAQPLQQSCSPTFTSQSFDDFHRLLGKGLDQVDPNTACAHRPVSGVQPQQLSTGPPSTERTKTAPTLAQSYHDALIAGANSGIMAQPSLGPDSYNLFAQQSAFAASQHSAYVGKVDPLSDLFPTYPARIPSPLGTQGMTEAQVHLVSNPVVVSEPSHASSDQGGEDDSPGEGGTTGSDITSNDSDDTNSESSRKRARFSYTQSDSNTQNQEDQQNSS